MTDDDDINVFSNTPSSNRTLKITEEDAAFLDKKIRQELLGKMVEENQELGFYDIPLPVPRLWLDVSKVREKGAKKHGADSYLKPGVFAFNKRTQSQFRHLMRKTGLWDIAAQDYPIKTKEDRELTQAMAVILSRLGQVKYNSKHRLDEESGLPHELHEACNALMFYEVIEKGILKEGDS